MSLAELQTGGLNRNRDEILEIESKLNGIEERINKDKVANYLKEDILNNEKITPRFLRLAKTVNTDSLEKIRDDNGRIFESKKERGNFMTDFYRQLYKVPDSMPRDFTGCIENFLGGEVCNHPTVLNSKLHHYVVSLPSMDQLGAFRAVRSGPSDLQLSEGVAEVVGRLEQVGLVHCIQVEDARQVGHFLDRGCGVHSRRVF